MIVRVIDFIELFFNEHRLRGSYFIKKIKKIDTSKANGYAFEGDLLPKWYGLTNWDIDVGDLILIYADVGSAQYHTPNVIICKFLGVNEDKVPKFETLIFAKGRDWALQILTDEKFIEYIKQNYPNLMLK